MCTEHKQSRIDKQVDRLDLDKQMMGKQMDR